MATAYQSVSHGDALSKHWDQAVPIPDEDLSFQPPNMFDNNSYSYSSANNYPAGNPNSEYGSLRESSRALKSQRSGTVSTYIYNEPAARDSSQSHSRSRRPSKTPAPGRKRSVGTALNEQDVDDSAWIHRDKLAQIESREMAQAGIRIRHRSRQRDPNSESRAESRSASRANDTSERRNQSRDRLANQSSTSGDASASMLPPFQDRETRLAQYQQEHDSPVDNDPEDYDPAMLQFVSNDKPQHSHSRSISRPITSRIPVARASPAPVSTAVVGRDSPLTRSRAGSSALNNEIPSYRQHRARSQSLGSQGVLDEVIGSRKSTSDPSRPVSSHIASPRSSYAARDSPSSSPPKKVVGAKSTSMNGRKPNAVKTASTRSRTTSAVRKTSPGSRPVSASKRPQGDAPWIATMYKPDPRLPQDQQLLPTHAKRMMQGEQDGNIDRDFNKLDDQDLEKMGAFPSPSPQIEQAEPDAEDVNSQRMNTSNYEPPWPLSPITSETRGDNSTGRQSVASGGGYKITPTIPLPAPSPVPSTRPGSNPRTSGQQKSAVTRVPDPEMNEKESGKKEKSCGCCIVM